MIDINDIQIEHIQNETRFSEFQTAVVDAIESGRIRDTLDLRLRIQQFFQEYSDLEISKPELFKNYRKIILYIELELFEFLTEDLQVMLLEKYLTSFAQLKLDVGHKVDIAIVLEQDVLQDEKRDTFTAALLQNQQHIGTEKIELEGRMVSPTTGSWAAKYRLKYGQKNQDELVRMDFCERDEARTLSSQERIKLRTLIDLVEELKVEPEKEDEEEYIEDASAEDTTALSPLYVPLKKPKVPFSQMPQSAPASHAQPIAAPHTAHQFRSLADLHFLDLDTVQNFGVNFSDFVDKVKDEVQKVYTRSPESKPHIVDLWRQSALYHLYAEMSEESMQTRKPISEVVKTRTQNQRPTLTKEQFDLVASLTKAIQ